jgi:hypothetical protein
MRSHVDWLRKAGALPHGLMSCWYRRTLSDSFLLLDDKMELLYVGFPLQVSLFLYLTQRVDEYERVVTYVHNGFFTQNIMALLLQILHQYLEFFSIHIVIEIFFGKGLWVVCHQVTSLLKYIPNSKLRGICLNFEGLFQIWKAKDRSRA